MREWGLEPEKDLKKICSIGFGGLIQKKNKEKIYEVKKRHEREINEAIMSDITGDGFIYEMFCYEISNHEYGYTGDEEDTLDALGYTWEQIETDKRLKHGLEKAIMRYFI